MRTLVLVFLAATACSGTEEHRCPAVGCAFGAMIRITPAPKDAVITVCRNAKCASATSTGVNPSPFEGDIYVQISRTGSDEWLLNAGMDIKGSGSDSYFDLGSLKDGDVYDVRVTQDGQTLVSRTATVTYTPRYPNGEACGEACKQADIDARLP